MANSLNQHPVDLKRIQDLAGGDKEFEQEVLRVYLTDCIERLEGLRQALEAGDNETARRHAHTIKGASCNIGTVLLHECARRLEHCKTQEQPKEAAALLKELGTEFGRVQAYLEAYLNK